MGPYQVSLKQQIRFNSKIFGNSVVSLVTLAIPIMLKNRKDTPLMPPDLALRLTLISSNCPYLEHIFMVPMVFELLKFACTKAVLLKHDKFWVDMLPI